ncbi:GntR family transcriptional regulator, partial [Pseudomonas graminis]
MPNTVNAVYERMKSNIQDGTWPPGSKLPSESELIA